MSFPRDDIGKAAQGSQEQVSGEGTAAAVVPVDAETAGTMKLQADSDRRGG